MNIQMMSPPPGQVIIQYHASYILISLADFQSSTYICGDMVAQLPKPYLDKGFQRMENTLKTLLETYLPQTTFNPTNPSFH